MALAPAQRPLAAKVGYRDLADILFAVLMMFGLAIVVVAAVVFVIKQVLTDVQITEKRAQLRTIALRSAESVCVGCMIKPIVLISLIVIEPSFLGVAELTQKETKSNRLRLIVGDAISAKSSRPRCAQCVNKKLKIPAFIQCAPRSVKRPLWIVTAKVQPW